MSNSESCVCCGAVIPEGRQVCPKCEHMGKNQPDLIDRNRLLRDPYFQEDRYPESHLLRMAVREQPTVDAVEVVRCKDCRKGHPELAPNGGVWCAKWNHVFGDDGFCSYGERKDNG